MKLKALLAMIFLSFLSSSTTVLAAASEQGLSSSSVSTSSSATTAYRKFIIYYGWYFRNDDKLGNDINRIINAKPEFVISPYYTSSGEVNLKPEVISMFHDNNIKVMIYVATGNAGRNLGSVFRDIKVGFDSGADGVMLDEVATLQAQWQVDYYKRIYDYAKSFDRGKIVIANPGSILVSEKVMSVSDIVSFEHQWRLAPNIDWFSKYPATRFMGVSSNDITNVMGYNVNGDAAVRDTIEAWQSGIGYHFSTDSYTGLAPWFEDYTSGLQGYAAAGAKLHKLTVRTVDSGGNDIMGLWVEIRKNDRVVLTGFSPANFILPEGSYEVGASDYQNYIFEKWLDGVTAKYYDIKVTNQTQLVAIYRNELADLSVLSLDNLGHAIKGMHISIIKDGNTVAEGFTPLYLKLPLGKYSINTSDNNNYYQFAQWSDSSNAGPLQLNLFQDTKVTAYYKNTLTDKVGEGIFSCQDDQYKQQVANAILEGGSLAGVLELHMKRSIMASTGCISNAP